MTSIALLDAKYLENSQQNIYKSEILIENAVKIRWNIWCGSW